MRILKRVFYLNFCWISHALISTSIRSWVVKFKHWSRLNQVLKNTAKVKVLRDVFARECFEARFWKNHLRTPKQNKKLTTHMHESFTSSAHGSLKVITCRLYAMRSLSNFFLSHRPSSTSLFISGGFSEAMHSTILNGQEQAWVLTLFTWTQDKFYVLNWIIALQSTLSCYPVDSVHGKQATFSSPLHSCPQDLV